MNTWDMAGFLAMFFFMMQLLTGYMVHQGVYTIHRVKTMSMENENY